MVKTRPTHKIVNTFFPRYQGLNSGPHLVPLHQLFFVMGFFEIESFELFTWLTSNYDPPYFCFLRSGVSHWGLAPKS
jgi:hypothetical protein